MWCRWTRAKFFGVGFNSWSWMSSRSFMMTLCRGLDSITSLPVAAAAADAVTMWTEGKLKTVWPRNYEYICRTRHGKQVNFYSDYVGRGGSLVDSLPFVRKVAGSKIRASRHVGTLSKFLEHNALHYNCICAWKCTSVLGMHKEEGRYQRSVVL